MLFTFKLDKPNNIRATFERLKKKLEASGGKLIGNEKDGAISAAGAEGRYTVESDAIKVVITKKPRTIIPNKIVENRIRAIFREICD